VKHGKNYNRILFHRKIHGVRESSQQGMPDRGSKDLILERAFGDSVIGGAQFFEKIQSKAGSLTLVPPKCRFDVEIGARIRD